MKAGRFFVALMTVFAVVATAGCGKSNAEKEREVLVSEGQGKISASNENVSELKKSQINLDSQDTATTKQNLQSWRWDKFSPDQISDIEARLNKQISLVDRIEQIGNHEGISLRNDLKLKLSRENAKLYLADLRMFEGGNAAP